jgi:geranylgeranyl reductase family protein
MRNFDVDVAIAGGGPAGAAAALALARAGRSVTLVDRQAFPRDKICGDLLGSDAVATLARLGLSDVLEGALPLAGAVLHGPRGTRSGIRAPELHRAASRGAARVLPRRLLDVRLLDRARAAGSGYVQARVGGVLREADGRIAGLRTSAGDLRAKVTIGADGYGSLVARALAPPATRRARAAVALRAYAQGVPDMHGCMHFFINPRRDGYAWVFPLPDGAANVGLGFILNEPEAGLGISEPGAGFGTHQRAGAELKRAFARFVGSASPARGLLGRANCELPVAWPIPLGWSARVVAAPGALLAGDAAALASPLSGSGIQNALVSGSGAARYALRALDDDGAAWRAYRTWVRARFEPRLRVERIVHDFAGTPERVEPWLAIANAVPGADALLSRALLALG